MESLADPLIALSLPVFILMCISLSARAMHLMLFERYFKLSFKDAPVWSLFYFSAWSVFTLYLFFEEISVLFEPINAFGYLLLAAALLVIFPFIYRELRRRVGRPQWLVERYPEQGMLSLEERYILAKIGDVVFQQFIAGAIILTLVGGGMQYPQIVAIFLLLFMISHLYIFRTAGFIWGVHYTAYAAFGGFAFPFLILFVQGGIAYAMVLHMLFYVLSSAFFAKLPHPDDRICRDCVGDIPLKTDPVLVAH